jgi:hypothetical protein
MHSIMSLRCLGAHALTLGSLNCREIINRKLIGETSRHMATQDDHKLGHSLGVVLRQSRGSWTVARGLY